MLSQHYCMPDGSFMYIGDKHKMEILLNSSKTPLTLIKQLHSSYVINV